MGNNVTYPAQAATQHASAEVIEFFDSFFAAKNSHDVGATMTHFSPELVTYTDTTLGWPFDGFEILKGAFAQYMPQWPDTALSYPTRILGGTGSALVAFTDTPELFGGELRLLGGVDFKDGKIVRWADYWDSTTSFNDELYRQMRTPIESFPSDFKESQIPVSADAALVATATQLQSAWSAGDAQAAGKLLSYDAVFEDMALRAQVLGRSDVEAYLGRSLDAAPYGNGSILRHIVGGPIGGGFEWIPATGSVVGGITAIEIDANGLISRLTTVYDSRQLGAAARRALVLKSLGLDA